MPRRKRGVGGGLRPEPSFASAADGSIRFPAQALLPCRPARNHSSFEREIFPRRAGDEGWVISNHRAPARAPWSTGGVRAVAFPLPGLLFWLHLDGWSFSIALNSLKGIREAKPPSANTQPGPVRNPLESKPFANGAEVERSWACANAKAGDCFTLKQLRETAHQTGTARSLSQSIQPRQSAKRTSAAGPPVERLSPERPFAARHGQDIRSKGP